MIKYLKFAFLNFEYINYEGSADGSLWGAKLRINGDIKEVPLTNTVLQHLHNLGLIETGNKQRKHFACMYRNG